MNDQDGFRPNVGMVLCNRNKMLFWGHRIGHLDSWQFPQGGIHENETPLDAMYRELKEEIGLDRDQVKVLGQTKNWLRYRLPQRLIRKNNPKHCIGQKQIWFLLELISDEHFNFYHTEQPEFDRWKWVDYWYPVNEVVHFKRQVYYNALTELSPFLFGDNPPVRPKLKKLSLNGPIANLVPRPLYRSFRGRFDD